MPSTPIVRLLDSTAAGLIAGTVPTIGTSSAARTGSSAIVEAVLQAITISSGSNRSASRPSRAGTRASISPAGSCAVGIDSAVGDVDDRRRRQQRPDRPEHRQPADAGIEDEQGPDASIMRARFSGSAGLGKRAVSLALT